MLFLRLMAGMLGGALAGAVLGFGAALIAMSVDGSHQADGTFGMTEMFTIVPLGAILGLVAGVLWALRYRRKPPAAPDPIEPSDHDGVAP